MENELEKSILKEVEKRIVQEVTRPFIVSVMGQTGTGKSSLINALFNTKLKTDPVRPCTKEIERIILKSDTGYELWFYDLPGIGESEKTDIKYIETYREMLIKSDVVLWTLHSDNRSVLFDLEMLYKILGDDTTDQAKLMSKIIFVLTKVDLITPPAWIFAKKGDHGIFAPAKTTADILEKKERYYQEIFIGPFGKYIESQTYNDGSFNVNEDPLNYDKYTVYFKGYLDKTQLLALKERYPQHGLTFDRLYDNYRVIPCSSLFRFNLLNLILVIINRLGSSGIARFKNFIDKDSLNIVSIEDVKNLCNIIVFDPKTNQTLFDLKHMDFEHISQLNVNWLRKALINLMNIIRYYFKNGFRKGPKFN
jgi:uncharacterized protein